MKETVSVAQLQNTCIDLKKNVISMIHKAQSGHPGGSLSVAEFITACYFREMDIDPKDPKWADRDRFVLSKGHVCPAQYAALAMQRLLPHGGAGHPAEGGLHPPGPPRYEEVPRHRHLHRLPGPGPGLRRGHGHRRQAGPRSPTGSSSAVGDGECNEGEIWEACQTAYKYQLDNLVVFVDYNNLQLGRHLRRDHAPHRPGRQVPGLWLRRLRDQRQRHGSDGSRPGPGGAARTAGPSASSATR